MTYRPAAVAVRIASARRTPPMPDSSARRRRRHLCKAFGVRGRIFRGAFQLRGEIGGMKMAVCVIYFSARWGRRASGAEAPEAARGAGKPPVPGVWLAPRDRPLTRRSQLPLHRERQVPVLRLPTPSPSWRPSSRRQASRGSSQPTTTRANARGASPLPRSLNPPVKSAWSSLYLSCVVESDFAMRVTRMPTVDSLLTFLGRTAASSAMLWGHVASHYLYRRPRQERHGHSIVWGLVVFGAIRRIKPSITW